MLCSWILCLHVISIMVNSTDAKVCEPKDTVHVGKNLLINITTTTYNCYGPIGHTLPWSFSDSTVSVYLSYMGLDSTTFPITGLSRLGSLHTVYLYKNNITVLRGMSFSGNVTDLNLGNNNITTLPSQLITGGTCHLEALDLKNNFISVLPPKLIENCTDIQKLNFANNLITSCPADFLRTLNSLTQLVLGGNQFTAINPRTLLMPEVKLSQIAIQVTLEDNNIRYIATGFVNPTFSVHLTLNRNPSVFFQDGVLDKMAISSNPKFIPPNQPYKISTGTICPTSSSSYVENALMCRAPDNKYKFTCNATDHVLSQCDLFPSSSTPPAGVTIPYASCPGYTVVKDNPCLGYPETGSILDESIRSCNPSYTSLICLCEGFDPAILCKALLCPNPGIPVNGKRVVSGLVIQSFARYSCNTGFQLNGSATIFCIWLNGTKWSSPTPTCVPIICPHPGNIVNGVRIVTVANYHTQTIGYLSVVTSSCYLGFQLSGNAYLTCIEGGWNGTQATCTSIICSDPGNPANGVRIITRNHPLGRDVIGYRSALNSSCNPGYQLSGNAYRTCNYSGWNGEQANCTALPCSDPGIPVNGGRVITGLAFQDNVSYSCNNGFQLNGTANISCIWVNGTKWTNSTPICDRRSCIDPGTPSNSYRSFYGQVFEDKVTYTCYDGFKLNGSATSTCIWDNGMKWSSRPSCNPLPCSDPGIPVNGGRVITGLVFQDIVSYSCNNGFQLNGTANISCIWVNGTKWSNSTPTCDRRSCIDPGTPSNSYRFFNGRAFEDKVTYACYDGFQLNGSATSTCIWDNGVKWSARPSCNRLSCLDLGTPLNGRRVAYTGFAFQDTISFSCNDGFQLNGSTYSKCIWASGIKWDHPLPTCNRLSCLDPGIPLNGGRVISGLAFQDNVSYSCNDGFQLNGAANSSCIWSSGMKWSNPVPSCDRRSCLDPGTLLNGGRVLDGLAFQDNVSYSCNNGFQLNGTANSSCIWDNGMNWSNPLPTCDRLSCLDPGTPPNGGRVLSGLAFQDKVSYSCNNGFQLNGAANGSCIWSSGMKWSNPTPTCDRLSCLDPGTPLYGGRDLGGLAFQDNVSYSCNDGFQLNGTANGSCIWANGMKWSNLLPKCDRLSCQDPGTPLNGGRVMSGALAFQDKVSYSCDNGFELNGTANITCRWSNGLNWSDPLPACYRRSCQDPGTPLNGDRVLSGIAFEDIVSYSCNGGFRLNGSENSTCTWANGMNWTNPLPECHRLSCLDPGTPLNGGRVLDGLAFQDKVSYSCNTGFQLNGTANSSCIWDNGTEWSDPIPTCDRRTCQDPGTPLNGGRVLLGLAFQNTVRYACNEGFKLNGSNDSICTVQADAMNWSTPIATCEPVTCSKVEAPTNGAKSTDSVAYNQTVRFSCRAGYFVNGLNASTCKGLGHWTNPAPTCSPVECGDPGRPADGASFSNGTVFSSVAQFYCNLDYVLVGEQTQQCLANGSWSAKAVACKPRACQTNPCLNQGACVVHPSGYNFSCRCVESWAGPLCNKSQSGETGEGGGNPSITSSDFSLATHIGAGMAGLAFGFLACAAALAVYKRAQGTQVAQIGQHDLSGQNLPDEFIDKERNALSPLPSSKQSAADSRRVSQSSLASTSSLFEKPSPSSAARGSRSGSRGLAKYRNPRAFAHWLRGGNRGDRNVKVVVSQHGVSLVRSRPAAVSTDEVYMEATKHDVLYDQEIYEEQDFGANFAKGESHRREVQGKPVDGVAPPMPKESARPVTISTRAGDSIYADNEGECIYERTTGAGDSLYEGARPVNNSLHERTTTVDSMYEDEDITNSVLARIASENSAKHSAGSPATVRNVAPLLYAGTNSDSDLYGNDPHGDDLYGNNTDYDTAALGRGSAHTIQLLRSGGTCDVTSALEETLTTATRNVSAMTEMADEDSIYGNRDDDAMSQSSGCYGNRPDDIVYCASEFVDNMHGTPGGSSRHYENKATERHSQASIHYANRPDDVVYCATEGVDNRQSTPGGSRHYENRATERHSQASIHYANRPDDIVYCASESVGSGRNDALGGSSDHYVNRAAEQYSQSTIRYANANNLQSKKADDEDVYGNNEDEDDNYDDDLRGTSRQASCHDKVYEAL
ncbi:sushi, von Willebrand factor type A, EGF and pentraxin domain-containing protein 1-like isoform X2 [Sycon ciliatum]|uniref:sushi, von Willebrand factor type A, EGF and pentraxin domain-containing protein 1-like isoform X2 n=1 Tax=Sycon ciliatum TaxID=27933 RepID=UPI0031F6EEB7